MRRVAVVLTVAAVLAGHLSAEGVVVAMKRDAGLTDFRGLDGGLSSALAGGATVYSGPGMVADVGGLWTDTGWAAGNCYLNNGASVTLQWQGLPMLFKFDVNALPGFSGSVVAKAELRLYSYAGNSGWADAGYITTSDWSEGSGNQAYPGAAGGVSGAHPLGYNTGPFQDAGGAVQPGYPASWAGGQMFAPAKDAITLVTGGLAHNFWGVGFDTANGWDQYVTLDVTPIVNAWANGGKPNYGMYVKTGNYHPYMSEETVSPDLQPLLVLDYEPVPEPMTLALLALGGLAVARRRV